jgi:hypothetical protein
VNFSELPPSKHWAALVYKGEQLAGVWFKPEGEPLGLTVRIPQRSFQTPELARRLTVETFLKAVGVAPEELESWRHGDVSHCGMDGSAPELKHPLLPPPQGDTHLDIHVRVKPPPEVVAPEEGDEPGIRSAECQLLETRWNAILNLEATIDTLRIRMEGLQVELETSSKQTLTTEEKLHALNADVMQWTKAKSRVHYAMPKVREFIHRANWAMGTPERKELGELFKDGIRPDIPRPRMDRLPQELDSLLKDRQVLAAHGTNVYQECKNVSSDIQGALTNLRNNAAARADQQRRAGRQKGKFFKDVRRWTGVD